VENPKSIVCAADLAEDQIVAEHTKHLVRSHCLRDPRGERRRKFVDDGRGRRPVVRRGSTSLSTIFDTYLLGNPLCQSVNMGCTDPSEPSGAAYCPGRKPPFWANKRARVKLSYRTVYCGKLWGRLNNRPERACTVPPTRSCEDETGGARGSVKTRWAKARVDEGRPVILHRHLRCTQSIISV
jgi:hypothetical protein